MEIYRHERTRDVLIVSADGGLDSDTADQFKAEINRILDDGDLKVIVDCTSLNYVSSYGLGVLLLLHRSLARRGGDVRLAGVKGTVAKVLSLTRLDEVFAVYPDVNRALLSFRPPTPGEA